MLAGFITIQLRVYQLKHCEKKLLISSFMSTSLSAEKTIAVSSAQR